MRMIGLRLMGFYFGNVIATAVEQPRLDLTKATDAPYSSSIFLVIGRPIPIPWPKTGSVFTVVDSNGLNHFSPLDGSTPTPVFSICTFTEDSSSWAVAIILPCDFAALTALLKEVGKDH